jgi:hypothetical protein
MNMRSLIVEDNTGVRRMVQRVAAIRQIQGKYLTSVRA